jgi:hypothetical protein
MNVSLPNDAKYAFFIDDKQAFHHEWDVNWSFTYRLHNDNEIQIFLSDENSNTMITENNVPIILDIPFGEYGFCTFLTKTPNISSFLIGHYMGFFQNLSSLNGEVAIAFDRTGLFALSSTQYTKGVSLNDVKPNSLIIRDINGVVYNETLSNFPSPSNQENTLRFRFIHKNTISIEQKTGTSMYKELVRVPVTTSLSSDDKIYPAFFYTSPVSSNESSEITFYMKNFHVQGNVNNPTYS